MCSGVCEGQAYDSQTSPNVCFSVCDSVWFRVVIVCFSVCDSVRFRVVIVCFRMCEREVYSWLRYWCGEGGVWEGGHGNTQHNRR